MDNLFFFPKTNPSLIDNAGCACDTYRFSYKAEGNMHPLEATKKAPVKLSESTETWKVESDGLNIKRRVVIEFPDMLKGPNGVACAEAELGVCIIWTNRSLTQRGYILPVEETKVGGSIVVRFDYDFAPGQVRGDLMLETVLYIKKKADNVRSGEMSLINEAGVTVGELDTVTLDFGNAYMDFPIMEVNEKDQPLWWMEFSQWEDPTTETFSEDNVRLYLNSYYGSCPKVGDDIKNLDMLIEIITTAYFLIFTKIADIDKNMLEKTKQDSELEEGSICKMMSWFCSGCDPELRFDSPELLQKTIHQNVVRLLRGEEE